MTSFAITGALSPSITTMIRADHSHVLVTAHKYGPDIPAQKKRAIVNTICLALEVHAQLEEEIFYPALREAENRVSTAGDASDEHASAGTALAGAGIGAGANTAATDGDAGAVTSVRDVLDGSKPEHDEMRRLIGRLHATAPEDPRYDELFHALMRDVLHHVADEETVLLPRAEQLLEDRLGELGARMTRRRIELAGPHVGEMVVNQARVAPVGSMLLAGGVLAGIFMLARAATRSPQRHRSVFDDDFGDDFDYDDGDDAGNYDGSGYPDGGFMEHRLGSQAGAGYPAR
ncbi:MAG: hemerythrin domain-containing protein [Lautropia sp.]